MTDAAQRAHIRRRFRAEYCKLGTTISELDVRHHVVPDEE